MLHYQNLVTWLLDFLRSPLWQFIAIFLTIILSIGGILLSFWKQRKVLSYEVIFDTSAMVVKFADDLQEKLDVSDTQADADMKLVVLRIWNSGNTSIAVNDYDRPITFTIEGGKILESQVLSMKNEKYRLSLQESSDHITLDPVRLRPGGAITIGVLLQGINSKIDVVGRIIGTQIVKASHARSG
jgi:hypothetical protein